MRAFRAALVNQDVLKARIVDFSARFANL